MFSGVTGFLLSGMGKLGLVAIEITTLEILVPLALSFIFFVWFLKGKVNQK